MSFEKLGAFLRNWIRILQKTLYNQVLFYTQPLHLLIWTKMICNKLCLWPNYLQKSLWLSCLYKDLSDWYHFLSRIILEKEASGKISQVLISLLSLTSFMTKFRSYSAVMILELNMAQKAKLGMEQDPQNAADE